MLSKIIKLAQFGFLVLTNSWYSFYMCVMGGTHAPHEKVTFCVDGLFVEAKPLL